MTEPSPALARFQSLMRELFQFDSVDLDFGIYRILNARRQLFADWIEKDLPASVRRALSAGAVAVADAQAHRFEELAAKLREEHEDDTVIDGDGQLRPGVVGKTAREYRELWQAQQASRQPAGNEREAEIYNRLYDFFRRYYEDGDFLSLRRYGADDAYAVPYNGQEVMLHWANRDQYYVKTGEHFTDYRFRAGDTADAWHVEFRLQQAETDRDNTKASDKRHFFFDTAKVSVDAAARTLIVPVAWRAAIAAEAEALPSRNPQDAINVEAEKKLLGKQALKGYPALLAALRTNVAREGEDSRSLLARHLRRYTRRNTSDFFIHKDLRGFLTRELDNWLKAEVLQLDTLLGGGEQPAQAWLQTLACLRDVAMTIINFVARVEDFQKSLYEKRKFVTECHWCLTLDHVERAGLTDQLAKVLNGTEGGKAQKAEWKALFAIDEVKASSGKPGWKDKVTAEFLRSQPHLMLDTVNLPSDFTDALLGSIENLDQTTGGMLVNADNWQALNLLMETHEDGADCIYIDPPYNTELDRSSGKFIYKDGFPRSSWLAMMCDRLLLASFQLRKGAPLFVSIDEHEFSRLDELAGTIFCDRVALSTWVKKAKGSHLSSTIRDMTEFVLTYSQDKSSLVLFGEEAYADKAQPLAKKTNKPKVLAFPSRKVATTLPDGTYKKGIRGQGKSALRFLTDFKVSNKLVVNSFEVEGPFVWGQDMLNAEIKSGSKPQLSSKFGFNVLRSGQEERFKRPTTLLNEETPVGTNESAFAEFVDIFGYEPRGMYPKPTNLIEYLVRQNTHFNKAGVVLDFFAGTGTTGHAVLNLNRTDGGNRHFVMVEMGRHFSEVMLPRLKKVVYSHDWKAGKPMSRHGISAAFKYVRLETYEDTLSNLRLRADVAGQGGLELGSFPDTYRLGYWLDVETAGSDSLLDVEQLERPFDYALVVHDGKASRSQKVDLGCTFNYLIGLIVQRRRVLDRDGRRYLLYLGRTRSDDVATAVLWRDIQGWTASDFASERDWIVAQAPFAESSVVYVNGDSAIPGVQSLDAVFHARMFAPVH